MTGVGKAVTSEPVDGSGELLQKVRRTHHQPSLGSFTAVIEEGVVAWWEHWTGDRPRRCRILLGEGRVRALVGGLIPLGTQPKVAALAAVHERIGLRVGLAMAGVVSAQLDSPVTGVRSTSSSDADELLIVWELPTLVTVPSMVPLEEDSAFLRDGACRYCLGRSQLLVRRVFPRGPQVRGNLETICRSCFQEIYPEEVREGRCGQTRSRVGGTAGWDGGEA